jgi:tetratricopeptide (TPR) repeat protein
MPDALLKRPLFRAELVLFGVVASCLVMPAVAQAESPANDSRAAARSIADEGADAYARGDYERARTLFARAYELVPAPTIALLQARSLVQLGRLVEAKAWYERAAADLDSDASEPFRNAQLSARTELAAMTPRIPRLKLSIHGDAAKRAEAVLDGQRVASRIGEWWELDAGAHSLRIQGRGVEPIALEVQLAERDAKTVSVMAASTEAADPRRTGAWVSFGVGAVGLATGIGAGIVATNAHAEAERECNAGVCLRGSTGDDAAQRFRDFRVISTLGYAVAAAGAGAGIALFLMSKREDQVIVALRPTLDGVHWEATW